jgi:hypothetical protein
MACGALRSAPKCRHLSNGSFESNEREQALEVVANSMRS